MEKLMHNNNIRTLSNLWQGERKSLKRLSKNDDIVIRQADKGATKVVWGKDRCIQEACRQLNNTQFYTPLSPNPIL